MRAAGPGPGTGETRHDLPASFGLTVSDSAAQPLDQGPTGSSRGALFGGL
jgi:hypothetical protein